MVQVLAISKWPSLTRVVWVFFAALVLSIIGVVGRNWLTYTHRTARGFTQ